MTTYSAGQVAEVLGVKYEVVNRLAHWCCAVPHPGYAGTRSFTADDVVIMAVLRELTKLGVREKDFKTPSDRLRAWLEVGRGQPYEGFLIVYEGGGAAALYAYEVAAALVGSATRVVSVDAAERRVLTALASVSPVRRRGKAARI